MQKGRNPMQVRRMRAAVAVVGGAALFVGLGAGAVGSTESDGGEPELPLNISPEEGPPGTAISVSADGCTRDEAGIQLALGDEVLDEQTVEVPDPAPDPDEHGGHDYGVEGVVDDLIGFSGKTGEDGEPGTGHFEGQLMVPEDDTLIGETLTVSATCNPVYQSRSFIVTDPGGTQPTTPTTQEPPVPTTSAPGGAGGVSAGGAQTRPPAPTASPVSGTPSYTG